MHKGWFYLHAEQTPGRETHSFYFNTYCWILKCFFFYIKKTFRKKIWVGYLLRSSSGPGKLMDETEGCYNRAQGVSGSTSSLPFPNTNSETPAGARVSDGSNWCRSWEIWQQSQLHTSQPLLLFWCILFLLMCQGFGRRKNLKGPYFSLNPLQRKQGVMSVILLGGIL